MYIPGDLISRRPSTSNSTTFYGSIDRDPAIAGTNSKRGDVQVFHELQHYKIPALVVATIVVCSAHKEKCTNCERAMEYAFVVWPGVRVGWVWIGYVSDFQHSAVIRWTSAL